MYSLAIILIVLASILLVLVVLVQNSKGGGLVSGFSSSNQIMGVRKTTDFLEKATWTLAGAIILFAIVSTGIIEKQSSKSTASPIPEGAAAAQQQEAAKTAIPNYNIPAQQQPQQPQQAPKPATPAH
ncbi:preprotein translocase subunit SecG [Microbacter margulisiae]|uniref:Protein-export membrane protein SecG n=1 Tax=Microbacter margulisiae TaxID=1350067 RepID=A0A7W5H394_9PORP|nr:preprotein translocase subunit SecG [Microbacter margulisiae]MBB3188374.1 preprotein translocase subunit SecG [Microbacter margulisiae]